MNYLAHLFLAGENPGMIVGALLEDYIKGGIENKQNSTLPADIKEGLRLHRFIDTFTDTDDDVTAVKHLFHPGFGKYAPVVVDVIFDHFLHKNWRTFAQEDFTVFKNRIYEVLSKQYVDLQPMPLRNLVKSMTEYDWLKTYIHFWGVEKALSSLNRKVKNVDLTKAVGVMQDNYELINNLFLRFFGRLQQACKEEFDGK